MFIELLDALRCPAPHDPTWLVARFDEMRDRHIVRGTLGCPECRAEYAVEGGIVHFAARDAGAMRDAVPDDPASRRDTSPETVMRLVALLDLAEAGGHALVTGAWSAVAAEAAEVTPVSLIVVNPAGGTIEPPLSAVTADDVAPFAPGSARALALDESLTPALRTSLVASVRAGGRVLGTAAVALPDGVREIARDEAGWVAERTTTATPPVRLVRAAR